MLNIPASTINYWVYTFDELDPPTTKGGHRRYRPEDVELIKRIKVMMHDKVMSIEGAKKQLKNSNVPYRGFKCRSAAEAINYLQVVEEALADNPRLAAMLQAVENWVSSVAASAQSSNEVLQGSQLPQP